MTRLHILRLAALLLAFLVAWSPATAIGHSQDAGRQVNIVGTVAAGKHEGCVQQLLEQAALYTPAADTGSMLLMDVFSSTMTPDELTAVVVRQNIAFVADGRSGVLMWDISNPRKPKSIGVIATIGKAMNVKTMEVASQTLLIVYHYNDYTAGFDIIDITTPMQPKVLSYWTGSVTFPQTGFDVQGNLLYGAQINDGWFVLDLSDPTAPKQIHYEVRKWQIYEGIHIADPYLILQKSHSIQIFDNRNLRKPVLLGESETEPFSMSDVVAIGHYLYFANLGEFKILDISDPAQPRYVRTLPIWAEQFLVDGACLYIASINLVVMDIVNPANPTLVLACDLGFGLYSVAIFPPYLYATDLNVGGFGMKFRGSVFIIDLATANPALFLPEMGIDY